MATTLEASRVILGGGELNLTLPVVPDSKRKSTIISLFCGGGGKVTPLPNLVINIPGTDVKLPCKGEHDRLSG